MDARFQSSVAALSMLAANDFVDLSQDDLHFLKQDQPWIGKQRNVAQRCIESFVYGTLDVIAMPRFNVPVEVYAAVIALVVHPCNWLTACAVCAGGQFSDDVAYGREDAVRPDQLFAFVLRIYGGSDDASAKVEKIRKVVGFQSAA